MDHTHTHITPPRTVWQVVAHTDEDGDQHGTGADDRDAEAVAQPLPPPLTRSYHYLFKWGLSKVL
jgi:hypothetical protein